MISYYLTFAVMISKDSELEEETELVTSHKHLFNLILSCLIENCQSSNAVAKELRQVVSVVLTYELQISLYVWARFSDEPGWSEVSHVR